MRNPLLLGVAATLLGCTATTTDDTLGAHHDDLLGRPDHGFAASVALERVTPIRPGFLRLTLAYAGTSSPSFTVATACAFGPDDRFTTRTAYLDKKARRAFVDLMVDYDRPAAAFDPCRITKLRVGMSSAGGGEIASVESKESIATEYDLAHLTPGSAQRTFGMLSGTEVALALAPVSRRYAAYPPVTVAIVSRTGTVALAEVEELPARGTLGLRWMTVFARIDADLAINEIGGGAELDDGFGLDVDGRGVTKPTAGLEHAHFGHATFDTGRWQPSFLTDPSKEVLPAPPRFSDATYLLDVLDNRGLPRELTAADALDVVYDAPTHRLVATNGARVKRLEHDPIGSLPVVSVTVPRTLIHAAVGDGANASASAEPLLHALEARAAEGGASIRLPTDARAMRELLVAIDPPALRGTAAAHVVVPRPEGRPKSPEEASIEAGHHVFLPLGSPNDPNGLPPSQPPPPVGVPITKGTAGPAPSIDIGPRCVLAADASHLTASFTMCDGWSGASGCPTSSDPGPIDRLQRFPGTPTEVSVLSVMTPLRAGVVNTNGTCGTHADNQAFEALMNLDFDDEGTRRVVLVDGLPIGVPEPRVALSHAANLAHLYSWMGTQADATSWPWETPWPDAEYTKFPQFPEGLWPVREDRFGEWAKHVGDFYPITADPGLSLFRCNTLGYWVGGYCVGQGVDPPGIYRSYSRMALGVDLDPMRDGLWSLANGYNPMTRYEIPFVDRDQAVFDVLDELRHGTPVRYDFFSAITPKKNAVPSPLPLAALDGISWYLPEELATCDFSATYDFGGGHAVNIVGAVLRGPATSPDPFRSFFVIENNWGKTAGHDGLYAINFAAWKLLGQRVYTYRFDRACGSNACRH